MLISPLVKFSLGEEVLVDRVKIMVVPEIMVDQVVVQERLLEMVVVRPQISSLVLQEIVLL
jgi:hypothetical protein